jgi:hypothetical protein
VILPHPLPLTSPPSPSPHLPNSTCSAQTELLILTHPSAAPATNSYAALAPFQPLTPASANSTSAAVQLTEALTPSPPLPFRHSSHHHRHLSVCKIMLTIPNSHLLMLVIGAAWHQRQQPQPVLHHASVCPRSGAFPPAPLLCASPDISLAQQILSTTCLAHPHPFAASAPAHFLRPIF